MPPAGGVATSGPGFTSPGPTPPGVGPSATGAPSSRALRRARKFDRRRHASALAYWDLAESGSPSAFDGVRFCGTAIGAVVGFETDGEIVRGRGVRRCGLGWVCADCSETLRIGRAREVERAAAAHVTMGGTLAMLTLTLRHDRSMSLADLLGALIGSWGQVQRMAIGRRLNGACVGWIRALEITQGSNGWHPHLHLLLLVDPAAAGSRAELELTVHELRRVWCGLIDRRLGARPSLERSADLTWMGRDYRAAAYVSKIAKEVTLSDFKSGRDPLALLDDADPRSVALFFEYAAAIKGRQAIAWSKGLRDRLGIREATDDEILDEPEREWVRLPVTVEREVWNRALREGTLADLLVEIEAALPALDAFARDTG